MNHNAAEKISKNTDLKVEGDMKKNSCLSISRMTVFFLIVFLMCGSLSYAAGDKGEAMRLHVSSSEGIPIENLEVGNQEFIKLPLTGKEYYYGKVLDRTTGKSFAVATDESGNAVNHEDLRGREQGRYREKYGKLVPALANHLAAKSSHEKVKVSFWLKSGEQKAETLRPTKSEIRALGLSRDEIRQIKKDSHEWAKIVHGVITSPLANEIKSRGYEGRASEIAPMVFAELTKAEIEELSARADVDSIDLLVEGGPEGYMEKSLSGGPDALTGRNTVKADVVESRGITGDGYKYGVVEGDGVSDANPYLNNATHSVWFYNSTTKGIDDHATAVAGFMASTHSTARGTAPGIDVILSANAGGWNLSDYQPAVTWAYNQGAQALNNSYYLEEDCDMHNSDRWADYLVRSYANGFIKSAGNRGEYADACVTSPGKGFNIITVGGIDDINDSDWSNDQMAALSSYNEPANREKPEVSAVACGRWVSPYISMNGTTKASPWTGNVGCGTSYAAPAATGMFAALLHRKSDLENWPEAVKAIMIASALHNIEGSSRKSEIDGAGAIDMAAGDYIAANDWYDGRSVNGNSFTNQKLTISTIHLSEGERFRAALAYDSNPSSNYTSDPLEGDLDLYLYDSTNTLVASSTGVDSWEIIEWTVAQTGDYTLVVYNFNDSLASTESTYMGVAWWPGHYLLETAIQSRGTPTSARDHYRVDTSSATDWWAIALRSPSGGDYDIALYNESQYGNPVSFTWLEDSTTSQNVDIVVIDRNHASSKSYYPIVYPWSGSGTYSIQRAIMGGSINTGSVSQTTTPAFVAKVWDIPMTAGVTKYFSIVPFGGNADLGVLLFDSDPATSSTFYQGRSQAVASSDIAGAGAIEQFSYTPSASDTLGLVVYNNQGQTVNSSWTLYVDTTAPSCGVSINSGAAYTSSTAVTLTLSSSDSETGVGEMRFSNDNSTWSAWEPYAVSKAWSITAGDATKTVYVQVKNNAQMATPCSDTIILDTTAPTGTVSINSGSTYTTSTSVTLTISCSDARSGCSSMRFSNDMGAWSAWEPYAVSKAWTINSGESGHYVDIQFRDAIGNITTAWAIYDYIVLDTVAPTGTISINSGDTYTNSTSVTLTLSCTDATSGCSKMRFSNNNSTWSGWEAYAVSKAWTTTSGDGTKTVYVQYQDNAGKTSGSYADTIILDTVAPSGTVSINFGAGYTNSTSVTLSLTCSDSGSGCYQMRFSNDNSTWSGWEANAASKAWTLTAGNGTRTVYVQFKDNYGYSSGNYTDTIILDTTNPTGTISINSGDTYTNSTSATLTLSCTDTNGCSLMRFSNDADAWSAWEPYAVSKAWTINSGEGLHLVDVQFMDSAGNVSTELSIHDYIVLDTLAPTGTISINSGAVYTTSASVTLSLSCSDTGSGCSQMRFSNDNATWTAWEPGAASKSWTLAGPDGTNNVYVQFKDAYGYTSGSYSDTIILDTAPPSGTVLVNGGDAYTSSTSVTLALSCTDTTSGCVAMQISNDGAAWSTEEPPAASRAWTLTAGDGEKTVYARYKDNAGNWSSPVTDTIILDTAPPTGSILINNGDAYTRITDVVLTLSCTDSSGCSKMKFSSDGSTWTPEEDYAASRAWTLAAGDGTKTVFVKFKDNSGKWSTPASDTIALDSTPPAGTIVINSGSAYTTSTSVTLSLSCTDAKSGCSKMKFSNNGSTWTTEENYAISKVWTLTSGDGVKTVFVKYKDNAGNWAPAISDTIVLDSTPPAGTIEIDGGSAYTTSTNVTLSLTCFDARSGCSRMQFSNDGVVWSASEPKASTKTWTLTAGDGEKTVYVMYRDNVGNWSGPFTDTIILDTSAPSGTVIINSGDAYTNTETVTLGLACTDLSGCSKMKFSDDGTTWTAEEDFASSKAWTFATGDGTKTVFVKFRDNVGRWSVAASDNIVLDTTPPAGTIVINGGAASTSSTTVSLSLTWSDARSGCASMQFSNDGVSWSTEEPKAANKTWVLDSGAGSKTVYVRFKDNAGNWSAAFSDSIELL